MLSTVMNRLSGGLRFTVLPVKIDSIQPNPRPFRHRTDEGDLMSLAASIRQNGVLQPLFVRRNEQGNILLVAGERRLKAAKLAGLSQVPCLFLPANPQQAALLSLNENLQRVNLDPFEEAECLQRLVEEQGLTREEVALQLGKAQSTLFHKLQLLELSPWQRRRIQAAGLHERQARALLRLEEDKREETLNLIIARQMTVGETEMLVEKMLKPPPPPKHSPVFRDVRLFVNTINRAVDTMRRGGVQATAQKQETDRFIEYHILIPKPIEGAETPPSPPEEGEQMTLITL